MSSGRLEKEVQAKEKMNKKLSNLPEIFTSFYNWLDAREKTYTTMDNYINHVAEFMKFITNNKNNNKFYERVTDEKIDAYMASIRVRSKNGEDVRVGDDIRAAKWSSLNTFFKFLIQKRYITVNPMLQTERPKMRTKHTVTYMKPEEIKTVLDRVGQEARKMLKNRDMCIIALGLTTGLRVSAIVNINMEDIDFKANTIKVVEKGNKAKSIIFADNLRNILLAWIKDREIYFEGEETGPFFMSQAKQRISVDSVERLVKKYTSHLPKHITPHKLRSTAAMNLYSSGVGILTIASMLGHENVSTTQRYTTAYDEEKENAVNLLDDLL